MINEGMASSIALARFRFIATVASIQLPQFTQRQAGTSGRSVLSSNCESVVLGTMKPWQREQISPLLVQVVDIHRLTGVPLAESLAKSC